MKIYKRKKSPFAKKLETLRKAKKLSMKRAAKASGFKYNSWMALEYDRSKVPKIDTIVRLAKFFGITVDELIKDTQHE